MLVRIAANSFLRSQLANSFVKIVRHNHIHRSSTSFILQNNLLSQFKQTRNLSHEIDEEDEISNYQHLLDLHLNLKDVSKDEITTRILDLKDISEVKHFIEENLEIIEANHIIQLLLLYGKFRNRNEFTFLKNRDDFLEKISTILPNFFHLTGEFQAETGLAILLLHLRLLGIKRTNETMQKIIENLTQIFKEKGVECESISLSIFTEAMLLEKDLFSKLIMVDFIPLINSKLEKCSDAKDFYHLISCLNNIHAVVSIDALTKYKAKIEDLLDNKIIDSSHTKIIFKIINFLNFPHWSEMSCNLIQRLLNILQKSIPTMDAKSLFQTKRAFSVQLEPNIIPLLRDRALELLQKHQDVELLQIVCMYCTPDDRTRYVEMFKDKILKFQTTVGPSTDSLSTFFKILRLLRVSDIELVRILIFIFINQS